ncbi:THAP domain-containing protein 1-like [Dermacentor albipictus]|uniref:THAP domain-containing protein 1-like n=1 Tax=Dermacentor albipictus TaxID=60249 RepID=UPI0038FC2C76
MANGDIDAVERERCLCDLQHKDYKSRGVCEAAWRRVAAELGAAVSDVRARWKNLRDTFRRVLKGRNEAKSGAAADDSLDEDKQWMFFVVLLFLKDSMIGRPLPLENPALLHKWLEAMGQPDFKPSSHHLLCSTHFKPADFRSSLRKRLLLEGAVPSQFEHPSATETTHDVPLSSSRAVLAKQPFPTSTDHSPKLSSSAPATAFSTLDHECCSRDCLETKVKRLGDMLTTARKKIKALGMRTARVKEKNESLQGIIANMKERNILSDEAERKLKEFGNLPL